MSFSEVLTPTGIAIGAIITLLNILSVRGADAPSNDPLELLDRTRLSTGLTVLDMLEIEGLVEIERWEDNEIQRIVRRADLSKLLPRAFEIASLDRCAAA